jgi:hypothetical protein
LDPLICANENCINGSDELGVRGKAQRITDMNTFEIPALDDEEQACWRTGRKSRFKIRGKPGIDWVNSTM